MAGMKVNPRRPKKPTKPKRPVDTFINKVPGARDSRTLRGKSRKELQRLGLDP